MSDRFKLHSPAGTMIGHIMIPHELGLYLTDQGNVNFVLPNRLFCGGASQASPQMVETIKLGRLVWSYFDAAWCREYVMLLGVSLEEFETVPGCYFTPGAAYLRSLIE